MEQQFFRRFCQFVQDKDLFSSGQTVVAAISGGVDSVVMLDCLVRFAAERDLSIVVAHFNHALRGEESDQDEAFVRELAEKSGLPCFSRKEPVARFAERHRMGLEEAGRILRYRFLEDVRQHTAAHAIATAHHASDQAETLLFRMVRGTGWRGLGGIPAKRGAVVRPLLFAYREEIEAYAKERNLPYRQDRSNLDLRFKRNVIRHQILPLLKKEVNTKAEQHLNQLAEILREGEEFLHKSAEEAFEAAVKQKNERKIILEFESFCSYYSILQKYILFLAVNFIHENADILDYPAFKQALRVIHQGRLGKFVDIGERVQIGIDHSGIVIRRKKDIPAETVSFAIGDLVKLPGLHAYLISEYVDRKDAVFTPDPFTELIDAQKISGNILTIRRVRKGDRFQPLGMAEMKKVSDFFIDEKVPLHERWNTLVVENAGRIVWLIGRRLDERFRVQPETGKCVKFQVIWTEEHELSESKTGS